MSIQQQTLTGDTVDIDEDGREHRGAMLWCPHEADWVLRSKRHSYPYDLYESPSDIPDDDSGTTWTVDSKTGEDYEESEPREVGGEYRVDLHFSATWSATVKSGSKDQAIEDARDQISVVDDAPVTADELHEDVTKQRTITEEDDDVDEIEGWPW